MASKSILLIEYEASIRDVLHTCLSELGGWRVTLSASIQRGIDLCIAVRPDVILLDTSTSEVDALLFVEQLKQYSLRQSIPILLITARASWFTPAQLQTMGFAGAITKPFNPSTLSAQVSYLLGWSIEENSSASSKPEIESTKNLCQDALPKAHIKNSHQSL
jgi:DNA-binding response OmpR family regulator